MEDAVLKLGNCDISVNYFRWNVIFFSNNLPNCCVEFLLCSEAFVWILFRINYRGTFHVWKVDVKSCISHLKLNCMCKAIKSAHIHECAFIVDVICMLCSWIFQNKPFEFILDLQRCWIFSHLSWVVWDFASGSFITVALLFYLVERSVDGVLLSEAKCIHCNGSEQSFSAPDASGSRWVLCLLWW